MGRLWVSRRVELTSLLSFLALVREMVEACDCEACSPLFAGSASLSSDLTCWDGFASRLRVRFGQCVWIRGGLNFCGDRKM
jgi:hypothetical protein